MTARILVIEDNETNLDLMCYLLRAHGYSLLIAMDGETALETTRQERPDCIICDVQLPKLDGYGVVARLKSDPELSPIPVIAVTAMAMVGDREKALAAGFDGYLPKPIDPLNFTAEIEAFLPAHMRSGLAPGAS